MKRSLMTGYLGASADGSSNSRISPSRIRKVDAAERAQESGNVSPWIAFFIVIAFFLLLGVAVFGKQPARHLAEHGSVPASRIVNVTLDTVMWIHDQHRGKLTWAELNDEVCRHMRVKRTEPWQRR